MIKYGINNIRELVGHKVNLQMVYDSPICQLESWTSLFWMDPPYICSLIHVSNLMEHPLRFLISWTCSAQLVWLQQFFSITSDMKVNLGDNFGDNLCYHAKHWREPWFCYIQRAALFFFLFSYHSAQFTIGNNLFVQGKNMAFAMCKP